MAPSSSSIVFRGIFLSAAAEAEFFDVEEFNDWREAAKDLTSDEAWILDGMMPIKSELEIAAVEPPIKAKLTKRLANFNRFMISLIIEKLMSSSAISQTKLSAFVVEKVA